MSEPTSAMTFRDLIVEVAHKLGTAHYGADGREEPQPPEDGHDLAEAKRIVNSGVRMFIADGPPPNGWRWLRPTSAFALWKTVHPDPDNILTPGLYDSDTDSTVMVAQKDTFFETMEERTIEIEDGGGEWTIRSVNSATEISVRGDATIVVPAKFKIESNANYTLPRDFGGQYLGGITFEANTQRGVPIDWTDEVTIRRWRENVTKETGTPFWAAIRLMSKGKPRRRWELMTYPDPDELFIVEFPYVLHFDKMVDLDEVPPAPFGHDEAIKAAVRAKAEMEIDDAPKVDFQYYREVALPNSWRVDAQSAPKKLGYFYNPGTFRGEATIQRFRAEMYQRPKVTFVP